MSNKESRWKEQSGFTLIEVVASIVIISIVLIGVMNLITFTNKTAIHNNDRLVAINLGKATIERMKLDRTGYVGDLLKDRLNDEEWEELYDFTRCSAERVSLVEEGPADTCSLLYQPIVNSVTYEVTIRFSQTKEHHQLNLINVLITVELPENKIKTEVEGYISLDEK